MNLLNDTLIKSIPALYATENIKDPLVQCKFFTPDNSWSWYVLEYDKDNKIFFGYVSGLDNELGYFSLDELESYISSSQLKIKRDIYFTPTKLSDIKRLCNDRDS